MSANNNNNNNNNDNNEKKDFLNKDSNDNIINMISAVINYVKTGKSRVQVINEFMDFYQNYPSLVTLIIDDPYNFDMKRVVEMLKVRDKIKKKEISYDDASLYMGQRYYEEFVDGKVNK